MFVRMCWVSSCLCFQKLCFLITAFTVKDYLQVSCQSYFFVKKELVFLKKRGFVHLKPVNIGGYHK